MQDDFAADPAPSSPGLKFPPPLAYGAGLALGFWLQHLSPVHIVPAAQALVLRALGIGLVAFGAALAVTAIRIFRRARTTIRPDRGSTALVMHGPFRYTRNPMYMSLACVHAGIACIANALWPLAMLVPALLVIRLHVIAREERYLQARFGAAYKGYAQRVRRWL